MPFPRSFFPAYLSAPADAKRKYNLTEVLGSEEAAVAFIKYVQMVHELPDPLSLDEYDTNACPPGCPCEEE